MVKIINNIDSYHQNDIFAHEIDFKFYTVQTWKEWKDTVKQYNMFYTLLENDQRQDLEIRIHGHIKRLMDKNPSIFSRRNI